jgi:subtilisin family serine protease
MKNKTLIVLLSAFSALTLVAVLAFGNSFFGPQELVQATSAPTSTSASEDSRETPSPTDAPNSSEGKAMNSDEVAPVPEGPVTSLIVSYKDGASPLGADKQLRGIPSKLAGKLKLGEELGFGFWTLIIFKPVTAEVATSYSQELLSSPLISSAEPDFAVAIQEEEMPVDSVISSVGAQSFQSGATWGLDRIDQRTLPLNGAYEYDSSGIGVTAYVVDTGVFANHDELGGRVLAGFEGIGDGRGTGDCNSHGTHVSGTIAGTNYGVAKNTRIVPVRVLDCAGQLGTTSLIVQGLDWIRSHHQSNPGPAVVNMSLVLYPSTAVDQAVQAVIDAGITVVAASGNTGTIGAGNSCLWSPARVPAVITVNASDASDNDATFSNYGSCSDLYAPGVSIRSAGIGSTTEITTKSGTSMATPHVTGAVARILSEDPTLTPAAVATRLMSLATNIDFGLAQYGDPNKLLFMGIDPNSLVSRLAGADRYSTSVAISSSFSPDVPIVYVATGENYPDALSAASAAAVQGGPLLLTDPGYLPGVIRSEINRLRPTQIVVVGGAGAVSDAVYNELATLAPTIRRDSGPDRFSTSRLIAERAFTGRTVTTAFIATGHDFPDALSAGAAAATLGAPVILVDGAAGSLDGGAQYLMQRLGVTKVYIAGGTGVVSAGIENSLRQAFGNSNVVRLSGPDRYSTSRAINAGTFTASQKIYLAVGTNFPDSLSGAALAGVAHAPLYIVPSNCVPGDVLYDINRYEATNVVLLGGAGVLSAKVAALTPC